MSDVETPERILAYYERQRTRLALPLGRRIDAALREARMISHVSGTEADSDHISMGKASSSAPPGVEGGLYEEGDIVELYSRRFGMLAAALEKEVDAHKYRPLAGERMDETAEEKDARIIRDFEGVPADEVSFVDPTLGTARTIERVRQGCGRRPSNGRPRR